MTETNKAPSPTLKYVAVPSLTVSQVKQFGQYVNDDVDIV